MVNGSKSLEEVLERFRTIAIPDDFDMIVAIANGGIVPAAILNQRFNKEVRLVYINLRDESQQPRYDRPRVLHPLDFDVRGRRVLLVDDRVKSGSTFAAARELLAAAASVRTFAVNGKADHALYDEACFRFPWNL
ncbi:MAG: phosphoribosyltransferase [Odoribacteraceae bacterium]|jgi:xanthine phosphoribosyltransferase|nr:phosphoribosyltransferase [Odoribacteraceae bacterium]